MKKLFLIGWMLISVAKAQPPLVQDQLERLADANGTEAQKSNERLQQLDEYLHHPLSVNAATAVELNTVGLFSERQVDELVLYRQLMGSLVDLHELQAVPGWDLETIMQAVPYLTVSMPVGLSRRLMDRLNGSQMVWLRWGRILQPSKGYMADSGNRYMGSRDHLLLSYKYQSGNLLYFGATADKDPGERFFHGAQSAGFDFYSAHFFVRNLGCIKALALGDYTINLGQGLVEWQSDGFGKSGVVSVKKMSQALSPYRSAGESGFNRGAGITLGSGRVELTVFGSYKKISGSIDKSQATFGSLQAIGYYRTPAEIANRYRLRLLSAGARIAYQGKNWQAGFNFLREKFSLPWQKRVEPYNYFAFSGQQFQNMSLDWSYTERNRHWFGEAAVDHNLNKSVLAGLIMSAAPKIDLSFLYRKLSRGYAGIEGSAFTENSLPSNEEGIYAGLVFRPASGLQLDAHADLYHFPWLRYRVSAPACGFDNRVELQYQPDKRWIVSLRYAYKNQVLNDTEDSNLAFPEPHRRQNVRLHITDQLSAGLALRSRVEWVGLKRGRGREEGFLVYEECSCRLSNWLKADLRLQYTETGSYDTRIYAYESDVLYSFSIPANFGKMYRYYLTINAKFGKRLSFWGRWAKSFYPDIGSIGSGLDAITGNRRTEIKIQAAYHWD